MGGILMVMAPLYIMCKHCQRKKTCGSFTLASYGGYCGILLEVHTFHILTSTIFFIDHCRLHWFGWNKAATVL